MLDQHSEFTASEKSHASWKIKQCIEYCLDCFKVCEETLVTSMTSEMPKDHLVLLSSCAEICQTSAKFMLLKSDFHAKVCGLCSTICSACADSCEEMDDPAMKECIVSCRRCAESCAEMSAH